VIDDWRNVLYPLGFVAKLLFGWRFLQQWILSEKQQESVVTPGFWRTSILANGLLCLHACFQGQSHVGIVQALNLVLAWRNLNLMEETRKQWALSSVLGVICLVFVGTCSVFWLQGHWFRIPFAPEASLESIHWFWHLVGATGIFLFASRFWIQWWDAEMKKNSALGVTFWVFSLLGSLLSIGYFFKIGDWVNLISPLFGLIPYYRNLVLIYRKHSPVSHTGGI
jgi:lipid-A-disaccharide synthase